MWERKAADAYVRRQLSPFGMRQAHNEAPDSYRNQQIALICLGTFLKIEFIQDESFVRRRITEEFPGDRPVETNRLVVGVPSPLEMCSDMQVDTFFVGMRGIDGRRDVRVH